MLLSKGGAQVKTPLEMVPGGYGGVARNFSEGDKKVGDKRGDML
jgi:hypothetical protein